MGLAERRAIKEFQDTRFPELKKAIEETAGMPVQLEVAWDTLASDGHGAYYREAFEKVYFIPLQHALKSICADELGRDALKKGLKKVLVHYTGKGSSYASWSFEDGVLDLDHPPVSNVDDVDARCKALTKLMERKL